MLTDGQQQSDHFDSHPFAAGDVVTGELQRAPGIDGVLRVRVVGKTLRVSPQLLLLPLQKPYCRIKPRTPPINCEAAVCDFTRKCDVMGCMYVQHRTMRVNVCACKRHNFERERHKRCIKSQQPITNFPAAARLHSIETSACPAPAPAATASTPRPSTAGAWATWWRSCES